MESLRVVFKDGVFVPLDKISIPEGTEGIVVYTVREKELSKPAWWNSLSIEEDKKKALLKLSSGLKRRINYLDLKVVGEKDNFEVFVLVVDETTSLKPAMEEALKIYEETGVYIPIQVISERRLMKWKDMDSPIYKQIKEGVSIG